MHNDRDSKNSFKFSDTQLIFNSVRQNPLFLVVHNTALGKSALAKYNLKRVELKTFTFSSGSRSLSIENAVLRPIPKLVLFTTVKDADLLGSVTTSRIFSPLLSQLFCAKCERETDT